MGKKYLHPPLIETLCEFQFDPHSAWDASIPMQVYEKIKSVFPIRRQAINYPTNLQSRSASDEPRTGERMHFLSPDERSLVQVGVHLLAVNCLKPYPSWQIFLPLIRRSFQAYCKSASPKNIFRIGLRYINRLELPGAAPRLEDYLEFYPYTGPLIERNFRTFVTGIDLRFENGRDILRMQSLNTESPAVDTSAVLLDLDYFCSLPGHISFVETYEWLELAHDRIEQTFEASITPRARELFGEVH